MLGVCVRLRVYAHACTHVRACDGCIACLHMLRACVLSVHVCCMCFILCVVAISQMQERSPVACRFRVRADDGGFERKPTPPHTLTGCV